jgi:hypothetical protein
MEFNSRKLTFAFKNHLNSRSFPRTVAGGHLFIFYLTNALANAIKNTKVVHKVADLKILSFDVSH